MAGIKEWDVLNIEESTGACVHGFGSTVAEPSKYRRVLLKNSSVLSLVPLPFIGSTVR